MYNTTNSTKKVKVAASQFAALPIVHENIKKATDIICQAHLNGAEIILLQELFMDYYFCQLTDADNFCKAIDENSEYITLLREKAKALRVILIVSYFERMNNVFYNTVVVIEKNGAIAGKYRKNHIPDGPGYEEKFYFSPGDLGIPVFETSLCKLGVGICWDQWFPEQARILALKGADMIFYPTAIGSEPRNPEYNSREHWKRTIQGHSAANMIPVIVSNRIGKENYGSSSISFYGSSFITNCFGEIVSLASGDSQEIIYSVINIADNSKLRNWWGMFRDRRPEIYNEILTKDGIV